MFRYLRINLRTFSRPVVIVIIQNHDCEASSEGEARLVETEGDSGLAAITTTTAARTRRHETRD